MAEVKATIPENSEQQPAAAAPNSETPEPQATPSEPPVSAEPKRGRGRPAGAKDKIPRVKVRAEPSPTEDCCASPTVRACGPSCGLQRRAPGAPRRGAQAP